MRIVDLRTAGHPRMETLALYAAGDLPWRLRWRTGSHIKYCADCEQQVLLFRSAAVELKHEAETQTLTGFEAIADWSRLEREMLGNIAVGVAAARCIEKVSRTRSLFARAVFGAALVGLFIAGWMRIPREQTAHLAGSIRNVLGLQHTQVAAPIVVATPDSIAVRAQGATLTLLHPRSAVVSLSGVSAVGARYIDEQTGQVTITNVYGQ
jgi:hypothetical protein